MWAWSEKGRGHEGKGCTRARSGSAERAWSEMGVVSEERGQWVWLEGRGLDRKQWKNAVCDCCVGVA